MNTRLDRFVRMIPLIPSFFVITCGGEPTGVTDPNGNGGDNTDNTVASVVVSPSPATVERGSTVQLQAQARNSGGSTLSGISFTWSSLDTDVATVNSSGVATGASAGLTTITATASGVSGSISLAVTQTLPQFAGFDFPLSQGDYWDFFWTYEYNSVSSPQAPVSAQPPEAAAAGVHSVTGGHFRITLGSSTNIQGVVAYEILMSGTFMDVGGFNFTPRWQYIAVAEHQILGSQDGQTMEIVFDAWTGTWSGGGFWAEYSSEGEVTALPGVLDNEFITTEVLSVRRSDGQDYCETIAGYTICPNDQAYTFHESEQFKRGIGPVGFHSYVGHSFSGGGFFDSFSHERTVGLVASSLAGADSVVPSAPPWIQIADMPLERHDHSAAAVDGKIYVMGGQHTEEGNSFMPNAVHIYDTASDTWTTGAPMPEARKGHASAAFDGKIYVIGGLATGSSNWESNVWVYDPTTDGWADSSPAYQTFGHQTTVVWGDYIFMFPYTNKRTWAYEVAADVWWLGAEAPYRYNGHAAGTIGGIIYLVGGHFTNWNVTDYTRTLYVYDPSLANSDPDAWTTRMSMPTGRDQLSAAVVDGKLFAIGGYNTDGPQRAVEMYDPTTNTWSERFPLMTGTRNHTAVTVNGKIYVIGGRGYYESVGSVYVYDPANEW